MLGHRLEDFPFPIAYPARALANAEYSAEQVTLALQFGEAVTAALGVLALGWCRAHPVKTVKADGVDAWHGKLSNGGANLSTWTKAIRAATKRMGGESGDPFALLFRSVATRELMAGLEQFQRIRNGYSHGGMPRSVADRRNAVTVLYPGASAVLDRVMPVTQLRLGAVRSCGGVESDYWIELELLTASPPFPTKRVRAAVPAEEGTVLAFLGNDLVDAIDLSPYCIWRTCPTCRCSELFYLHQRKGKQGKEVSYYFSFSTGHELEMKGDVVVATPAPPAALGIRPVSSGAATKRRGWRARWSELADRPRRMAARALDLVAVAVLAFLGTVLPWLLGAPTWVLVLVAAVLALSYEPVTAWYGGSLGKRLLRIEPIGCFDGRALSRGAAVRRAVFVDLAIILWPIAVYDLAWLLWDPARQCLHDRHAECIVVAGRSRPGQKR